MKEMILLVDENSLCADTLTCILSGEYLVKRAKDEVQMQQIYQENKEQISAVMVDMLDDVEFGFDILKAISTYTDLAQIPVIAVCNLTSAQMEEELFSYGISECIRQPFNESLIRLKVKNVMKLHHYQMKLEEKVRKQSMQLEVQNNILRKEAEFLKNSNNRIIDLLGSMAEYRNQESGEHIQRVKGYTRIIAEEMMHSYPEKGLTAEWISMLVMASTLHDIGKIAITDTILLKPGKLTDKEFTYMKSHTISGCEILEHLQDSWSKEYGQLCMDICRHHHERYDGRGYPDGLKGDEIPLSAQIVALADVYDALVHERVYKAAIPRKEAYEMIVRGECGVFSQEMLECLTNCREKMEEL